MDSTDPASIPGLAVRARTLLPFGLGSTLIVLGLTGCPAKAPTPESDAQAGRSPDGVPVTQADDPRVVRDGEDLYAVEDAPRASTKGKALGSGRPDTSNGVCKLFAPRLPEPECCPFETGFDAEKIMKLCGHALYMGESLQASCGYHFMPTEVGGVPVAIRASRLNVSSVADAAASHDKRMARTFSKPDFASTPVPGLDGAMWSEHDGIHWAFVPNWNSVRLVSWPDDACPRDVMPEVLKLMANAKEAPANAPRPGLIPVARQ